MSQGQLPSAVGRQCESTKRNPARVRFFESRSKTSLEWVEHWAKESPGPGAYHMHDERPSTGKFSTARPIGYIDAAVHKGQREPGPFEYELPGMGDARLRPGGRFSSAFPKNFIELEEYRESSIPGPKYATPQTPVAGLFGKINEARPKTAVDWLVYEAQQKPAPGDYKVSGQTRSAPNMSSGGKFGTATPKTFIEVEELRTSDHPAPDSYRVNKLGVYAIRPKFKQPRRSFCSQDRLFSQLLALDQMAAKKVLTKSEKKARRQRKQAKKMANIRAAGKERARVRKLKEDGMSDRAIANLSRPEVMFSSRKLLKYKINKLDQVYSRYLR